MEKLVVESLYTEATRLARENHQTVGEKNDYYVTLQQLEGLLAEYLGL